MREQQKIGEILVLRGAIDEEQLRAALAEQATSGHRLCTHLFLKEVASEDALVGGLAAQQGVPGVALNRSTVDLSVLELIPQTVAERYSILALSHEAGRLTVAMADPSRRDVIEEVQFVTGTRVVSYVGLKGIIDAGLRSAYSAYSTGRRDLLQGPNVEAGADGPVITAVHDDMDDEIPSVVGNLEPADDFALDDSILDEVERRMGDVAPEILAPPTSAEPASSAPAAKIASAPLLAGERKARVLVVDDEQDIRVLLKTALEKVGYEVLLAERGLEALQRVKAEAPDLVLLDAMLPEIHGFEICKKIKESQRFSHIAVIMITAVYRGWRFALDVKQTYGADDYIEKPFSIADVLRRVEEQLVKAEKVAEPSGSGQAEIEGLRQRGTAALNAGEQEQALEIFRLAVEMDPFDAKIHFMLAMCLEALGQSFPAIYEFERAVELEPSLFPALKNLAVLYERKGFKSKSTEMWERALRHAPKPEVKDAIRSHLLELLG